MGQLGEMFPGRKLDDQGGDEQGGGQMFQPGPLDLDGGVIRLRRPAPVSDADTQATED